MNSPRYVKFPEMWWRVLSTRPATAADLKIALDLLWRAKFTPVVKYTNEMAAKLGISRQTKNRSLDRLGCWGLIVVTGRVGQSPLVRPRWLAQWQPRNV